MSFWQDVGALFTPSEKTKLAGIEDSATTDQTNTEIRDAVEAATNSNTFTDADHTKLNTIETGADVTDAANVGAGGAVMRESQNITLAADGTITPDGSKFIRLETYEGAATDDLNHVYLTNYLIGDVLTFTSQIATHDVTIRDNSVGMGMIFCEGDTNFTLSSTLHNISFVVIELVGTKRLAEYRRFNG